MDGRYSHGLSHLPEFKIWKSAKSRCFNLKDKMYKTYGARGITMCEEWARDFFEFYRHVGPRPQCNEKGKRAQYSLDRIDNNRGYEPGNVRWASKFEQAANKTNNKMCTICCQTKTLRQWCRDFGVNYKRVHSRLRYRPDVLEALHADLIEGSRLRIDKVVQFKGKKYSLAQLCREYDQPYSRVQARLYRGWSVEDAITKGKLKQPTS